MVIYKISNPQMIKEYFSGLPEGERPWEVWANDPLNSFSGGIEDLELFIRTGDDWTSPGWALSDSGLEGGQGFTRFSDEEEEEKAFDFLRRNDILWNPEYAVDYPEPWDTEE